MLKKAYVEITNRCNLACSFCPKTKRAPRTMSAQEFDLILSRLEGYVQYVYLHVMGEPLLHPQKACTRSAARSTALRATTARTSRSLPILSRSGTLLKRPRKNASS